MVGAAWEEVMMARREKRWRVRRGGGVVVLGGERGWVMGWVEKGWVDGWMGWSSSNLVLRIATSWGGRIPAQKMSSGRRRMRKTSCDAGCMSWRLPSKTAGHDGVFQDLISDIM